MNSYKSVSFNRDKIIFFFYNFNFKVFSAKQAIGIINKIHWFLKDNKIVYQITHKEQSQIIITND